MCDREKVIKGLKKLIDNAAGCTIPYDSDCKTCPYLKVNGCCEQIARDALELLKGPELTEQDMKDLEIVRRIRAGKSLKVVTGAYTIVNEAWRKEHPWVLPVRCKDCKYYEVKDHWGNFGGVPILAASDVPTCHKWSDGCMTKPDGYCFMGERRESNDAE